MANNSPIGLFDSGVGGLTVVREFMEKMPNEDLIYFGDTARVPYGSKSKEIVTEYSKQIVNFLESKNVKMIVIACNTATALAYEDLKKYTDIPIIEVITPGSKSAIENTNNKKVGIIGTEATIKSCAYVDKIKSIDSSIEVFQQACSLFVPLVEEGWVDKEVTNEICREYLYEITKKGIDTLVLGCTHYPVLKDKIEKICDQINVINPASETAESAKTYLMKNGLQAVNRKGNYKLYTSDYTEKFDEICRRLLDASLIEKLLATREKVNIESYTV